MPLPSLGSYYRDQDQYRGVHSGPQQPSMTGREISTAIEGEQEVGALERLTNFLGQPGFALRNLLSGEFVSAAKNVWDLGTGMLTLSPLTGYNPLGVTTREDRPEFTDLLDRWGVADREKMGKW